jgi:hypothetical protein
MGRCGLIAAVVPGPEHARAYRERMRGPIAVSVLLSLLAVAACSSGSGGDDRGAPATSSSAPDGSPPASPAVPVRTCDGPNVVDVADAHGLQQALDHAGPGQVVRLADGRYEGAFVASADAPADAPIQLCGGRGAILDGGATDGGYTLHLSGASHWVVWGFTVTGGQKGVMVDAGVGNRIESLLVTSMGDEAIHLRTNSTDNAVVGNSIRDTGLREPKYGEGIYVGTAESNWCQLTDCEPDRSDRNLVEANDIAGTTAEAVDIKEGTSDGVLRGNVFDGSAMTESDSWVDVKGNDWTVEGNAGTSSPGDGFQVHEVVDGWGRGTVFRGNAVDAAPGLAINVAGPSTIRDDTTVACDNDTGGAGRSNVTCSRS